MIVGIDPGVYGAVAVLTDAGPVTAYDLMEDLVSLQQNLWYAGEEIKKYGGFIAIEDPHTRPGEGAERCFKFGKGIGRLEGLCVGMGLNYKMVSPNLWTGRLGLPGKSDPDAVPMRMKFLENHYPGIREYCIGPRGGLKDGRIDAFCIAHFMKTQEPMSEVVKKHGRGSAEAQMAVLSWGGNRKNHKLKIRET